MQKLRIRFLMRAHALTESQANAIATLIWGGDLMMHDRQINDPAMRHRAEMAGWLCVALEKNRPEDAAPICAAYLETVETGGPRHDPFGLLYSDARLWAQAAPPHELVAYTLAGLERLPKSPLSVPARKNLFKHLWRSFTDTDRAAFLRHVKGGK